MIAAFRTQTLLERPHPEPLARFDPRRARHGVPITVGTPDHPYEPSGRSLDLLEGLEEREISIVTGSPRIFDEIDTLVDLDRRCSVTVDLIVPVGPEGAAALGWKLEAVTRLSSEGIAARVLCPLPDGVEVGEPVLRRLFAAAREAGAWDVRPHTAPRKQGFLSRTRTRTEPPPTLATFSRLRLEYGFPREMSGRG
jgi:DNA repair photolyase